MKPIEKVSLVVPVFNEEDNLVLLADEIERALAATPYEWELWLVDDGSSDASLARIREICARLPRVGFLSFERNQGQSAAFAAGFNAASGDVIVTLDADLQNDPADIPAMLDRYLQGFDMVVGWRRNRQDAQARLFASKVGNSARRLLTGDSIRDTGCSLKVIRASLARQIPQFKGMHRFLPTMVGMLGGKIAEMPVNHRPRHSGASKYGTFRRGWSAFQDLLAVNWMLRRYRPGTLRERQNPSA